VCCFLLLQARFHNTNIEINMLQRKHRIKLELNRYLNDFVVIIQTSFTIVSTSIDIFAL